MNKWIRTSRLSIKNSLYLGSTAASVDQRQHCTLRIQKDVLPLLFAVRRVSRSCEHLPDVFDLHL